MKDSRPLHRDVTETREVCEINAEFNKEGVHYEGDIERNAQDGNC